MLSEWRSTWARRPAHRHTVGSPSLSKWWPALLLLMLTLFRKLQLWGGEQGLVADNAAYCMSSPGLDSGAQDDHRGELTHSPGGAGTNTG